MLDLGARSRSDRMWNPHPEVGLDPVATRTFASERFRPVRLLRDPSVPLRRRSTLTRMSPECNLFAADFGNFRAWTASATGGSPRPVADTSPPPDRRIEIAVTCGGW